MKLRYLPHIITRNIISFPLWLLYQKFPESILFHKPPIRIPKLTRAELRLLTLEPFHWYHNFQYFGVKNRKDTSGNQMAKQKFLFPFINHAIEICHQHTHRVTGLEQFCADAFFSNYALLNGASTMVGNDTSKLWIERGNLMSRVLGHQDKLTLKLENVFQTDGEFDFAICSGGLYHLNDPESLLVKLRNQVKHALVIQTAYSLDTMADDDYFESPAPGYKTWGSRFSYQYLKTMTDRAGWEIIDEGKNELTENVLLRDRGSAYLLCVPK
jgi:hypothetical protein